MRLSTEPCDGESEEALGGGGHASPLLGHGGEVKRASGQGESCPGERKALIAKRYSRMKVSEQNLRKTLSVENGWSSEIEAI